ncbi:MAG: peptidoglycan-binding protein [Ahrensia sp.]|nr:peptidoglycan-binding protein [Ahrensia sp.]
MSESFTSYRGHGSQGHGSNGSGQDDQERLDHLKRAIDSIEKRVAGVRNNPPFPDTVGRHHSSAYRPDMARELPGAAELASNRFVGQPPVSDGLPHGNHSSMQSAIAEIAARQSMLNGAAAKAASMVRHVPAAASQSAAAMHHDDQTLEGIVAIGRHLGDLKRELAGLKQKIMQPDPLRVPQEEIDRIAQSIAELKKGGEFDEETFARLIGEIEQMRSVVEQDVKHAVRSELAEVKHGDEERLAAVNRRFDELALSLDLIGRQAASNSGQSVDALAGQMDTLRVALDSLPQRLDIDELEKQLGEVAEKLEYTMLAVAESMPGKDGHQPVSSEHIASIERRLDEVSRALVAVSNMGSQMPQIDLSAVERVEARLTEVSRALDMVVNDTSQDAIGTEIAEMSKRLSGLGQHLESLEEQARSGAFAASQSAMHESDISIIEEQLRKLNERLEVTESASVSVDLREQIERLHQRVEEAADVNSTAAQIAGLEEQIRHLFNYMSEFPAALGASAQADAHGGPSDMSMIEEELRRLNERLDAQQSANGGIDLQDQIERLHQHVEEATSVHSTSHQMAALEGQIEQILQQLNERPVVEGRVDLADMDGRLADISVIEEELRKLNQRLDTTSSEGVSGELQQQFGYLHQRINEALEAAMQSNAGSDLQAQVAQILSHVSQQVPSQDGGDFSTVEGRLSDIEAHLATVQDVSLEAAQRAAEQAVAMMEANSEQGQLVGALSEDLKTLRDLAEQGSAKNTQSVQAVQETLAQLVDRLATIEDSIDEGLQVSNAGTASAAPFAAPQSQMASFGQHDDVGATTEHVLADAEAYLSSATADARSANVAAPSIDPAGHLEAEADAELARQDAMAAEDNMPLEPGSEAPRLERPTGETAQPHHQTGQASAPPLRNTQASVIDAARRAVKHAESEITAARNAQVAAAKPRNPGLMSKLKELRSGAGSGFDFKSMRRPIVLAAAVVLVSLIGLKGYQMLASGPQTSDAVVNQTVAQSVDVAPSATDDADKVIKIDPLAVESAAVADPKNDVEVRRIDDSDNAGPTVEQPSASLQQAIEDIAIADEADTAAAPVVESVLQDAQPQDTQSQDTDVNVSVPTDASAEAAPVETASFEVPAQVGPAALVDAAQSGDPKALFQIGLRYSEGSGVDRDLSKSAKWFGHAAELGFAPAQYSLGSLYEKGIGVDRDLARSAQLYEQAAQQGNARAMHNLAVIRATGNPPDAAPDMTSAIEWFKQAANLGIKDSQFNLGILYGQGMGVPQNLAESYKWFAIAAKTGDTDAAGKRDEVANAMDPDNLAQARQDVANWQVATLNEAANRVDIPDEWRDGGSSTSASAPLSQQQIIQRAQALLNERGFSAGVPDGLMGPATRRAISDFQRSAGIPVTGEVDQNLMRALDMQV